MNSLMRAKQSGAVLVVSLIILLVLTLLSVSAARTTLLQEKMTFAVNDAHLALKSAEMAIVDAENLIEGLAGTSGFVAGGTNGLYSTDDSPDALGATATWAAGVTTAATSLPDPDVTAARYYIEHLGTLGDTSGAGNINITNYGQSTGAGTLTAFRIVAKGTGLSDNSQRIIISYYAKLL